MAHCATLPLSQLPCQPTQPSQPTNGSSNTLTWLSPQQCPPPHPHPTSPQRALTPQVVVGGLECRVGGLEANRVGLQHREGVAGQGWHECRHAWRAVCAPPTWGSRWAQAQWVGQGRGGASSRPPHPGLPAAIFFHKCSAPKLCPPLPLTWWEVGCEFATGVLLSSRATCRYVGGLGRRGVTMPPKHAAHEVLPSKHVTSWPPSSSPTHPIHPPPPPMHSH